MAHYSRALSWLLRYFYSAPRLQIDLPLGLHEMLARGASTVVRCCAIVCAWLAVFAGVFIGACSAQTTQGLVSGRLVNVQNGAGVPGAIVTYFNSATKST